MREDILNGLLPPFPLLKLKMGPPGDSKGHGGGTDALVPCPLPWGVGDGRVLPPKPQQGEGRFGRSPSP